MVDTRLASVEVVSKLILLQLLSAKIDCIKSG
jgi:hypothetical protein